jgi:Zn-dependent protease with chaperone function
MVRPSEFIHPEDAAALRQLESIPGFPALVKKVLALGLEQLQYGINMASAIRLSPKQLPELYKHLPPICERLGIEEPEFYLQMNPMPNAFTFGDTKIFITITSGLVEMLDDEELDAVIAHECGHILCRHVLYNSLANYLKLGADALGILGNLTAPVEYALYYWNRKSELSCDRCAAIVTSPQVVARVMARLAGGPRSLTERISSIEWAKQADEYDQIRNSNLWNKALQISAVLSMSHPFAAVRVREILRWEHSPQYAQFKQSPLLNAGAKTCNACGKVVNDDWAFCKHCGNKLK